MDLAAQENKNRAERCECNLYWLCWNVGEKQKKIGEGTFANVYKGTSIINRSSLNIRPREVYRTSRWAILTIFLAELSGQSPSKRSRPVKWRMVWIWLLSGKSNSCRNYTTPTSSLWAGQAYWRTPLTDCSASGCILGQAERQLGPRIPRYRPRSGHSR